MGSVLYTEEGAGLHDHEGYVAHILDDGSSAGGTWTTDIGRRTVGWRCECSCGWAGPVYDSHGPHAPSDEQTDAMMDADWEAAHARPLLPLAGLDILAQEAHDATKNLRLGVGRARAGGVSWEQIGKVLGVSKQAVWERFGGAERPAADEVNEMTQTARG
ncbi:MAG: hypothetical protein M3011_01050 [Actinomycetota bacterium]|nr:hypothetical protein [Actinomycetota bacterium]